MPDGRTKNGGARSGAGPKSKKFEDDLHARLKKACKPKDLDDIWAKLVKDAKSDAFSVRHKGREMLFAYLYGKPGQMADVEADRGDDLAPPIADTVDRIYGDGDDGGTTQSG
jgi:hypothetical protein